MVSSYRSRRGIIFVLSAPSGTGKTTIARATLKVIAGLEASVSLTTRQARPGEAEGVDYHFVGEDEFTRQVEAGRLAEWTQLFEHRYGTPRAPLERAVAEGHDMLLDIDIQGARQIRAHHPLDSISILILPPSLAELDQRLRGRATEREAAIAERLRRAHEEASAWLEYDYLIVNADLDACLQQVSAVVEAERLKVSRLREGFAPWKN